MMALLMLLAQLSPGPLARPHADLEGVQHCNRCHTPRRGVEARKCLECHKILAARIEAGRGLHAQPEFHRCERCHVEHQGREAELIFWGEGGLQAFDHRKTGYPLEGAHRKIRDCRKCHNPENLPDPEPLRKAHKDLRRTFLGLSRSCTACHRDPHGGQFSDPCKQCHTMDGWKPAARFDHQRTRFPLTGKHAGVACAQCHPLQNGVVQYRGTATRCVACHRNPHRTIRKPCERCHTPQGWRKLAGNHRFDHSTTRFPLTGAHRTVPCEKCHLPGQPVAAAPTRCEECHADPHAGQLSTDCERCHTTLRFQIPRFTPEDHDTTRFPLTGAHRTVPCRDCHRRVPPDTLAALSGLPRTALPDTALQVFRFRDTVCTVCHADPHDGEFAAACSSCHTPARWSDLPNFDHAATRFPLRGAHRTVPCASCHRNLAAERPRPRPLRLDGLPRTCEGCHGNSVQGGLR